jgi:serum/glucocorticoid-regulated kinase 2
MQYAFQDYDNLYLVMDLLNGGDLRYHISRQRKFSERQTSNQSFYLEFFIACIVLGLEYIHNNKILHRDIKPENLVLDDKGLFKA